MEKAMATTTTPYMVTVQRPGLPDVQLGFGYRHQAEIAQRSLTECLRCTSHVNGTTISWSPTPQGVTPEPPVPSDPCLLADVIAKQKGDLASGHAFPDAFSRLKAQVGYAEASRIWGDACRWLDRDADDGA